MEDQSAIYWLGAEEYEEKVGKGPKRKEEAEAVQKILPDGKKVIVDLGIGPGTEVTWLCKIPDVVRIVGIDITRPFLEYCAKKYGKTCKKLVLVEDNFFSPKNSIKILSNVEGQKVGLMLVNTYGNFERHERQKLLHTWAKYLDYMILSLIKYKKAKGDLARQIISQVEFYALLAFVWNSLYAKYKRYPVFFFDPNERKVIFFVDGKRVFISHRWLPGELEKEIPPEWRVDKVVETDHFFVYRLARARQ